ncbi:hypothetical protein ROHU_024864 [Labeo rohita]|uniref:Uncharacterized protein n=1 Tax=Labeo rohita TaxID=84645 RepID=A0A498MHN7_LABRO|nr:hypothetical protein ROHU_024864 [Labeo rohita]
MDYRKQGSIVLQTVYKQDLTNLKSASEIQTKHRRYRQKRRRKQLGSIWERGERWTEAKSVKEKNPLIPSLLKLRKS